MGFNKKFHAIFLSGVQKMCHNFFQVRNFGFFISFSESSLNFGLKTIYNMPRERVLKNYLYRLK